MGKGSRRRPRSTSVEEEHIRYALAEGRITFAEYERRYNRLLQEGKIVRSGKVVGGSK